MPILDVDGGLVWNGYSPRLFTGRLPKEQYASLPFYFGGSNVPTDLGLKRNEYSGSGMCSKCKLTTKQIRKLPNINIRK